jgi:DNA-binding beta-propeller fold protein YncE
MVKRRIAVCALIGIALSAAAFSQQPPLAPNADIPVVHYKAVPEWPQQAKGDKGTPVGVWNFTQVTSVAVRRNGNILVLHRNIDPILEFTAAGALVRTWDQVHFNPGRVMFVAQADRTPQMSGYQGAYGPVGCAECGAHSIRVDPDDNVWVVDATGHAVYKLDAQGRIAMTLGTPGQAGQDNSHFYLPTDVAFAPNGDVLVSDGYGNARVVRFSHDGRYLSAFGQRGSGRGQFQLPHNLAVDAQGRAYVADRDNQRIVIFDAANRYVGEWPRTGGNSSVVLTPDQRIWTGTVLRDLTGKAIEKLPATSNPHGAAVAPNGDVYLGLLTGRVEKYVRQ